MDQLEKSISILIQDQFPEWYREEGPLFVAFVREYFEWMESRSKRKYKNVRKGKATINVTYNSANIVGNNTFFSNNFSNGDWIAIDKDGDDNDYEMFQIDTISNNTFLTLKSNSVPQFALTNANYGTVNTYGNPLYYSRRHLDNLDIDNTLEEFLIYFKQEFLNSIQFETITDTRRLVKNALDIYRSKGTERALDLMFRVIYGSGADIYYPSRDLFRTSSGTWHVPRYLELSPNENTVKFTEKQVTGVSSGATAFIESVVRRTVAGKIIDLAYISAINGSFQTGEKITSDLVDFDVEDSPFIVGSLNDIRLPQAGVGNGFNVGDILNVKSTFGREALARVANTSNTTGELSVELVDGGYGYTINATPVVSTRVITIANVQPNTSIDRYFTDEEVIYQPFANIAYVGANNTVVANVEVRSYHANGDEAGFGFVIDVDATNTSVGDLTTTVVSGNLQTGNALYFGANAIAANIGTYTDRTATGNVVGYYANVTLTLANVSGDFTANETIFGATANGRIGSIGIIANTGVITCIDSQGVFRINESITGSNSGVTANITSIQIVLGVKDEGNTFITATNNFVYGTTHSSNGTITRSSNGANLSFGFSNSLLYSEEVSFASDYLADYANVDLDAVAYGFPADASGNQTSNTIENLLSFTTWNIGKLQVVTSFNPGSGYDILPIVKIKEDFIAAFGIYGRERLFVTGLSSQFANGELVTQAATGGRGLVVSSNSSTVIVERLRFADANNFIITSNSTTTISGANSGATANITAIDVISTSDYIGNNALVEFTVTVGNGAITNLQIIDSGFGFVNGETINAYNNVASIQGAAVLQTHGTGSGFYYDTGGFLSDSKKIFDGFYWQEYSYEIRSSVQLNKYEEMLKKLLHVAGTQYFGNLHYTSVLSLNVSTSNVVINTFASPSEGGSSPVIFATGALTDSADTLEGVATRGLSGTVDETEDADTIESNTAVAIAANATMTESVDVLSSEIFVNSLDIDVALTESADTLEANTDVAIDANVSGITEVSETLNGDGNVVVSAILSESEGTDTLDGAGAVLADIELTHTANLSTPDTDPAGPNGFNRTSTWQNVPIGTASDDRIVVVVMLNRDAAAGNEMNIDVGSGDEEMNVAVEVFNSSKALNLYGWKVVNTGTTANISISFVNFPTAYVGAVYTITGGNTAGPYSTSTNSYQGTANVTLDIDVPENAIIIASGYHEDTATEGPPATPVLTFAEGDIVEDYNLVPAAPAKHAGIIGSNTTPTANATYTITVGRNITTYEQFSSAAMAWQRGT